MYPVGSYCTDHVVFQRHEQVISMQGSTQLSLFDKTVRTCSKTYIIKLVRINKIQCLWLWGFSDFNTV